MPASANTLPYSVTDEPPSQSSAAVNQLEGHEPSSRRGAPVNPVGDPEYANQPLVWMDFVTYVVEISMLSFAISFFACAVVFAIRKIWIGSFFLFFLSLVTGVVGLALPGLCLMLVKTSLTNIPQQWMLVNGVMVAYALCVLTAIVIPIAVSLNKDFHFNRKLQVALFSVFGGLFVPLFWAISLILAYSKEREKM